MLPYVIYKKFKLTIIPEQDLIRIQSLLVSHTNVLVIFKMVIIIHLIPMVEIYLNEAVIVNHHSISMTIQSIKVLLLFKMLINIIDLILILLAKVFNVLNSITREGVFQVIMNKVDTDNHHLNRFLEVPHTKLVHIYPTKDIHIGITNSSHHHIVSLTLLPSLILINCLLLFIIKHVMR